MSDTYLAHISGDGREQTVLEHLTGTAQLARNFAVPFHGEDQAALAAMAHDIGKYSEKFQARLKSHADRVDHSTLGAAECFRRNQPCAAFAVAGHHGGLPDGGTRTDHHDRNTFCARMNRAAKGLLENADPWKNEVVLPCIPPRPMRDPLADMFYTRMIYSCLVDADFLDTEGFMQGSMRQRHPADFNLLWDRLQTYIAPWFPPNGELNRQRCAILEHCIHLGERRMPGLFTLTVPTGGGKTIASLAFALAQAKAQKMDRIIYVIPYTSIIEQTAGIFREILGDENVLEHHSNVLFDIDQESTPESIAMSKATENWDMPVIVTTAVQFFESLYACRSSQCRKLHNLAGSVIIFDEAQMLPILYLRPCVHAISQLVQNFCASAVLCTATQPTLDNIFRQYLPNQSAVELCPPNICQWKDFRRVTFRRTGKLSWDVLADQLNNMPQVLCIVNSRRSAQEVFHRLTGDGCYHLSTLMYPAHRREQLDAIRDRLKTGLPCRVVSTSLIEAGVDVDFPAVFREECGLDSILQAAGRCNREGKRPVEASVVTVFKSEGAVPPLFRTNIDVGRLIMDKFPDYFSREAIHQYFSVLLDTKGVDTQDIHHIIQLCHNELFPFRTVAERFHLIENNTRTIYIPMHEGTALVEHLRKGERSRELFRQLGQYGIAVYDQHFLQLKQTGKLELLEGDIAILNDLSFYNEETGLSSEPQEMQALFI